MGGDPRRKGVDMETGTFFQMIQALIIGNATYSEVIGHRVISLHRLRLIYKQMICPQPLALLSLQDAVEEGVRKGYWEMDYDDKTEEDIVILC